MSGQVEELEQVIREARDYYRQGKYTLGLEQYQRGLALALPLGDKKLTAFLLGETASCHRGCDNYHHAANLLISAVALISDLDDAIELRANLKTSLAMTFKDIFGPSKPEVMELLKESLSEFSKLDNIDKEANILQHIGGIYVEIDQFSLADLTLQQALKKAQVSDSTQLQGWILTNMASLEIERHELGLALDYARNARNKVKTAQDLEGEGDTWFVEARVLRKMGYHDQAIVAAQQALNLFRENRNLLRQIRVQMWISSILQSQSKLDEAFQMLLDVMKKVTRTDLVYCEICANLQLSELEMSRERIPDAKRYAERAKTLAQNGSINNLEEQADKILKKLDG